MLESFTETRSTAEATEACTSIGPLNPMAESVQGAADLMISSTTGVQNPWDFDVQPDDDFADQVI